jgi:uncharacterized RDD family membrane protein YckC
MKPMRIEARPWKRFLAFSFDLLILNFILIGPFAGWLETIAPAGMDGITSGSTLHGAAFVIIFIIFVIAMMYFTLFDYLSGQSLGMMMFNLYTVDTDRKRTPGFWKCTGRNLAILPIFPFILLWIADPVFLAFKKTRISDLLTRSSVIEQVSYTQTG